MGYVIVLCIGLLIGWALFERPPFITAWIAKLKARYWPVP